MTYECPKCGNTEDVETNGPNPPSCAMCYSDMVPAVDTEAAE